MLHPAANVDDLLLSAPMPVGEPAVTAENGPGAVAEKGQQPLILVIDDNALVRRIVVDMLRSLNYRVAEAETGEAGLALMASIKPSAAVIDFLLPGFNGLEVAQRARTLAPTLPIVFLSGYFDTLAHDSIAGAVSLRKPLSIDVLRRTLEKLLG